MGRKLNLRTHAALKMTFSFSYAPAGTHAIIHCRYIDLADLDFSIWSDKRDSNGFTTISVLKLIQLFRHVNGG